LICRGEDARDGRQHAVPVEQVEVAGELLARRRSRLTGVLHGATINLIEIFEPVATIVEVESVDEAIRHASERIFGLMAYVFGEEREAMRVARRLVWRTQQSGIRA
jgi:hypothetical protein